MKIFVRAYPRAKVEKITKVNKNHFEVYVKEPPVKGRANLAIIKVLSEYFEVSEAQVKIKSGYTSREKIIEILLR